MIETTTTATVTCDKCGRQLAPGETFYQVAHAVAECVYDGGPITGMSPLSETIAQLCTDDYKGARADLTLMAPLAQALDLPPIGP